MAKMIGEGLRTAPIHYTFGDDAWRLAASNVNAMRELADTGVGLADDYRDRKDAVKVGADKIAAVAKLFGDDSGAWSGLADQLKDEEIPLSQRAGLASEIDSLINLGVNKFQSDTASFFEQQRINQNQQGLDMDRGMHDFRLDQLGNAAAMDEQAREEQGQVSAAVAPDLLRKVLDETVAMEGAGMSPGISSSTLNEALNAATPEQQLKIAETAVSLMPKDVLPKFEDVPVTIDGQPGKAKGFYDPARGAFVVPPVAGMGERAMDAEIADLEEELGISGGATASLLPPLQPGAANTSPATPMDEAKQLLELQKLQGDIQAQEQAATEKADEANAKSQQKVTISSLADQIEKHPGFKSAVGFGLEKMVKDDPVAGGDRAGAVALINQLKGMLTLDKMALMKGVLSDKDIEMLQNSAARLSTDQSEADFKRSLEEIRNAVRGVYGGPVGGLETQARSRLGLPE